ncbi:MAG: GWxTD domain-containing protein, partial [Bacteroidales bacterium]|nr:GWxTD domain-containing protein [Bacteroidales bacterium]
NKIIKHTALLAAIALITGCALIGRTNSDDTQEQGSIISNGSQQLALMYNPYSTSIHPKVFAKKHNLEDIELYVVINDGELLFSKANAQKSNTASVKIFYKIMESYEKTALIDSCTRTVNFTKESSPKTYSIKLKIKPQELKKFVIQTTVTDLLRGKMSIHFTEIDKTDPFSEDNYMITKYPSMQPLAEHYIKKGDAVRVDYLCSTKYPSIISGSKAHELTIPLSPYSSDPAVEDTTIFYNTMEENASYVMHGNTTQLYAATADTNYNRNLVLPCFDGDFPNIDTPDEMMLPIAYLATPEEFAAIRKSTAKKLAVDDFWYSCTHDIRRAKELIKVYYSRAIISNLLFTDYRKGMLTDRGMIYIVLGPPKMLAITSTSEVWTYNDNKSGQKVRFVFRRTRTKLCGEKYILRRSTEFKPIWDRAVGSWRKGNIFTF